MRFVSAMSFSSDSTDSCDGSILGGDFDYVSESNLYRDEVDVVVRESGL